MAFKTGAGLLIATGTGAPAPYAGPNPPSGCLTLAGPSPLIANTGFTPSLPPPSPGTAPGGPGPKDAVQATGPLSHP